MKEFKGTKGKWSKYRDTIDCDDGNSIAKVQGCYSLDVEKANAQLIASAPELLEALQELVNLSFKLGINDSAKFVNARKAINKALGE